MANIPFKSIMFPGLPNKYTVPEISNDLMTAGKAADAKATGDALSALEDAVGDELSDIKADLDAIAEQVGGGLTVAIKDALLTCLDHIAWDDDDPTGQSYISALESAFNMGTLTRITAAYTQSESVYWDTPLEALKSDLVVTGYWSNKAVTTISSSSYALSGDLSSSGTITVSCDGKTTTFTVTVSAPLYPLENGEHTFTTNSRELTITKGHHFAYTAPNATASNSSKGAYLNLSTVSDNNTSATTNDNITLTDVLFTIPSGASVVFKIKNIHLTTLLPDANTTKYTIGLRNGDGSTPTGVTSGDKRGTASSDITISTTASADTPITCVMMYISNSYSAFEADICLTVNGERWI